MWVRLNPQLRDCPQICVAGDLIGRDGVLKALGGLTAILLWSQTHETKGVIPSVIAEWLLSPRILNALVQARLLIQHGNDWILQQDEDNEFWRFKGTDMIDGERGEVRQKMSPRLRFRVFERDCFTCQYCGRKSPDVKLEVDHRHPVSAGGTNDLVNLITACEECNGGKAAHVLQSPAIIPFTATKRTDGR